MAEFLGEDYLIGNAAGQALFEAIRDLPIVDAHNHADVKEIWENRNYQDIWQIEASTDHYVWELLRKRGVAEHLITGEATPREKWLAAARVWDELAGNPCYEWVHLDLKRLLGIDELIDATSGERIWDLSKELLAKEENRPQALLKRMNVEVMCSTDDPIDSLEYHEKLQASELGGMVRPTFRPDRAMHIYKDDWNEYIDKLEARFETPIESVADVVEALGKAHDFFAERGCVASDHGVETPYAYEVDEAEADAAFQKARDDEPLSEEEEQAYGSFLLHECAAMDAEKDWVFQLHMGAVRDTRDLLAEELGPDSGGDVSDHSLSLLEPMLDLLNRFDGQLKMVLYCLDPTHQPTLATLTRAFGEHVNLGSAWWFNDTPFGMKMQLEYLAGVDLLANFAGMVSDSRKLFSYGSRHEMFRRCLCDVVGRMVEQGRVPMKVAESLVERVAYTNQKQLFGFS